VDRAPILTSQIAALFSQSTTSPFLQVPNPQQPPETDARPPSPQAAESLAVNVSSESESDGDNTSLEVVQLEPSQTQWEEDRALGLTLEQRVIRELHRRVQENSTASLSSQDRSQTASEREGCTRPGRGVLESDSEDDIGREGDTVSSTSVAARTHPSPLRVPTPSHGQPADNTRSAHPSGSPHQSARSGSPKLKGSTSLYRLPMSSSAPSIRGEVSMSRKLFSKGRERLQVQVEPLDSWEVVASDVPSSPMEPHPKSTGRFTFPSPRSLLQRGTPHVSPFIDPRYDPIPSSPTSVKDHKGLISFLHRPVRQPASAPSPLTSHTPPSDPAVSNAPTVPLLRIPDRSFSPSGNKNKVSPLPRDRQGPFPASPVERTRIESTSPPPTPSDVHSAHTVAVSSVDEHGVPNPTYMDYTPSTPVSVNRLHGPRLLTEPNPSTPTQLPQTPPDTPKAETTRRQLLSNRPSSTKFSLSPLSLVRSRHHYPGRPLPNPPPAAGKPHPKLTINPEFDADAEDTSACTPCATDFSNPPLMAHSPTFARRPQLDNRGYQVDDAECSVDGGLSEPVQAVHPTYLHRSPVAPPRVHWTHNLQ
jgi:hypothetical protein